MSITFFKIIPRSIRNPIRRTLKKILHFGFLNYCPVCSSRLRAFKPHGIVKRDNSRCPICGSLERHRQVWLFFDRKTNLFDSTPKKMLHVAPEVEFEQKFKKIAGLDYLSSDLNSPLAMVKMDITDIHYPDESFDVIYCSDVLEHVPEDIKALRELKRVLKPKGWAVILVPITTEKTFEDLSEMDSQERLRRFGHEEHVRQYGPDFKDRLEEAGFVVKTFTSADIIDTKENARFAIADRPVYYCTKGE